MPPNDGSTSPLCWDSYSRSQVLIPSAHYDADVGMEVQVSAVKHVALALGRPVEL
jgi:hypothetical protein